MCGTCTDDQVCNQANPFPLPNDERCERECGGGCDYELNAKFVPEALIIQICDGRGDPINMGNLTVMYQNCPVPEAAAEYEIKAKGEVDIDPENPIVDNSGNCQSQGRGYKMNPGINFYPSGDMNGDQIFIHTSCSCPLFIGASFVSEQRTYTAVVIGYKVNGFTNTIGPQDSCTSDGYCPLDHSDCDGGEPTQVSRMLTGLDCPSCVNMLHISHINVMCLVQQAPHTESNIVAGKEPNGGKYSLNNKPF